MEGNYCEARAKKKKSARDVLIKGSVIAGIVISILLTLLFGKAVILIVPVVLGILAYFLFPRLNVEYEYVFCDGQLDFDKIMNGENRKHLERIDMDEAVQIAPINSHTLDGYRHDGVKKVDYSSNDSNGHIWGIAMSAGTQKKLYYFEPSEEMIHKMKQKSPRKVSEY